jgi:hypothetical protein
MPAEIAKINRKKEEKQLDFSHISCIIKKLAICMPISLLPAGTGGHSSKRRCNHGKDQ